MKSLTIAILMCGALAAQDDLVNRREQAQGAFLSSAKGIYLHYCSACHGDDAKGQGKFWVTGLSPQPSDISATSMDEKQLVEWISSGSSSKGKSTYCPPYGKTVSPENIALLSRWLLALRGKSAAGTGTPNAASAPPQEAPFPIELLIFVAIEIILVAILFRRLKKVSNVQ